MKEPFSCLTHSHPYELKHEDILLILCPLPLSDLLCLAGEGGQASFVGCVDVLETPTAHEDKSLPIEFLKKNMKVSHTHCRRNS